MGKVFKSSPKIEVVSPQAVEEKVDAEASAEKKDSAERRQRGMDSTIRTSYNGILDVKDMDLNRKKLLGE